MAGEIENEDSDKRKLIFLFKGKKKERKERIERKERKKERKKERNNVGERHCINAQLTTTLITWNYCGESPYSELIV